MRQVDNALKGCEDVLAMNIGPPIKEKFRKTHVMGEKELDEWLEVLAEAIYETIGVPRTKAFELAKLTPLYPPSRIHFDYEHMISRE